MADMSAWDFSFPSIEAGSVEFAAFKGRVLLVANTASFCGYTNQYDGLQKLQQAAASRGLTVVGVPSRDFNQEFRRQRNGADVLRHQVRRAVSDDRHLACAWPAGSAVLRLGARADAVGARLELQQGADRS